MSKDRKTGIFRERKGERERDRAKLIRLKRGLRAEMEFAKLSTYPSYNVTGTVKQNMFNI